MRNLSLFFMRIATPAKGYIFFALWLVMGLGVMPICEKNIHALAGAEVGLIDLQFGFAPEKTQQMVAKYGVEGRSFYFACNLIADTIYPIIYTLFLIFCLSLRMKGRDWGRLGVLNLLPVVVMLWDYSENIGILSLLYFYPRPLYEVAALTCLFSTAKWISLAGVFLLLGCTNKCRLFFKLHF